MDIDPVELGTTLCEAAATGDLEKIKIYAINGADINQGKLLRSFILMLFSCADLSITIFDARPGDYDGRTGEEEFDG